MRGRRRNGIGKFASGGEGYLCAQIEAGVEVLRLAAVLVCSSDFGPCRLFLAIFFSNFWGSGFRSRRAPIIGSHAFARARLEPIMQGWAGMASNGFVAKIRGEIYSPICVCVCVRATILETIVICSKSLLSRSLAPME